MNDYELEAVKGTSEVDMVEKPNEQAKEQQRKGKSKLVLSLSKGDKRKYVTRSEAQKVMGNAIAASKAHTERSRKRRREGLKPAQPASTHLFIVNSETESKEAVKYVAKRRGKAEEERIESKGSQKGGKKSPTKGVKVNKQKSRAKGEKGRKQLEEQTIKGPGPKVKNQIEEDLTRKERVKKMEQQKVLNGRVFDPDILTQVGMGNLVDVVTIQGWNHLFEPPVPYLHEPEKLWGIILGVPVLGVRTIEGCKPSGEFSKHSTKRGDVKRAGLPKKFLKGEYQLMFEFINKVMVPRTEKRTVASAADLFLMEKLDELEEINLPAIMLEHMHRVMTWKNAKHGIPYGYLLNFVFNHFEIPVGKGATLRREVTDLTKILNDKEVEITRLKSELQNAASQGPGTCEDHELTIKELRDDSSMLLKTNASLNEEIKSLNKQLIRAHESANERMMLLMRTFTPSPPPS
ncbi:hypothetical protein KY290_027692 [Solanum tuberosum]|uniref:Uncharacterized protein n=1 Tax=Solanum tuberosum TaxID=4113 RepID=A0ABQ7UFR2_SOLTU|nr:hypothetical protein KY285_026665 [Solanum tuberosum]KAH0748460.1 hypothetical protein KY290_027692 [Solanum tuberosum]